MNTLLYDTYEQQQLQRLIERKELYLQRLDPQSRQAPFIASEISTLRSALLALQASQNLVMTDLVRSITRKLAEATRMPGAENLTGLLYYYRMREPDEERTNLLALTGDGPRDEVRLKDVKLYDGYEECNAQIIRL